MGVRKLQFTFNKHKHMSNLESKIKVLVQIRAGYNDRLLTTKSEKRRKCIQSWADEINMKIIKMEG